MEIKALIKERRISHNSIGLKFFERPKIKWEMKGIKWIPFFDGEEIPLDWKAEYTCSKCGRIAKQTIYDLKESGFNLPCKSCQNENKEKMEQPDSWIWNEVNGHKVHGSFEKVVAEWLIKNNIKFQTHGEVENEIYYTDSDNKKKKLRISFYIPSVDLIIETRSTFKDFMLEQVTENLKASEQLVSLKWDTWEEQLSEVLL